MLSPRGFIDVTVLDVVTDLCIGHGKKSREPEEAH
ncbi:hypothetical protein PRBEI_2000044000 [Prionailurus iriomotensis]